MPLLRRYVYREDLQDPVITSLVLSALFLEVVKHVDHEFLGLAVWEAPGSTVLVLLWLALPQTDLALACLFGIQDAKNFLTLARM